MLQRILRLITDCWQQWHSLTARFHQGQRPQAKPSQHPADSSRASVLSPSEQPPIKLQAADRITYSLPRSEVVSALNRIFTTSADTDSQHHRDTTETVPADSERTRINQVQSLADAAYLCDRQGRLKEAENFYQQALTLSSRLFGETHLTVVTHLSNLAKFYHCQQRYMEARSLLEKAIAIQQQVDSTLTSDRDVGDMLYQLADIYCYLKNYAKAEVLFQQALYHFRHTLGPEHERTCSTYGEWMKMLSLLITSGQFEVLTDETPPLDLDTLGETYSWAKPEWMNHSEPADNYSWIKLQISTDDEKA